MQAFYFSFTSSQILRKATLTTKVSKCQFRIIEMIHLKVQITQGGMKIDDSSIKLSDTFSSEF